MCWINLTKKIFRCINLLKVWKNVQQYLQHIQTHRVRINVSWFGKYDSFFNFHDANFPTKSKNHDTKILCSFLFLNRETFSAVVKNSFNMHSVSRSKKKFIFKCGCLITIIYIWKLKSRACKNFKIFCHSVLTIVVLYVTLKQVNVFHKVFHDATLKS